MKAANAKKAAMELTEELAKELAADLRDAGIGNRIAGDRIMFEVEAGGCVTECAMTVELDCTGAEMPLWPPEIPVFYVSAWCLTSGEDISGHRMDADSDEGIRRELCEDVVSDIRSWADGHERITTRWHTLGGFHAEDAQTAADGSSAVA